MKIDVDVDIKLTSQQLAELFCEMNDDEQTRFFGDVAHIMNCWAPHARELQISFIGSHLVDCECGGEGARWLIAGIHEAMTAALINARGAEQSAGDVLDGSASETAGDK